MKNDLRSLDTNLGVMSESSIRRRQGSVRVLDSVRLTCVCMAPPPCLLLNRAT